MARHNPEPADDAKPMEVRTGADLVAYWHREGLVGTRRDIADSQAEARRLREQAERRET